MRTRRTIDDLQKVAHKRGGRCLDRHYMGLHYTYNFECAQGHLFRRSGDLVVKRGSWCRECWEREREWLKR